MNGTLRFSILICAAFLTIIVSSPISAVHTKNRIEDELTDSRSRPGTARQREKSTMPLKDGLVESAACRDISIFGSVGKWAVAFVPCLPDRWSRRGKAFGLIGVGISTAALYRLRQPGSRNLLSLFTAPFMTKAASHEMDNSEKPLRAITDRQDDLDAFKSNLSERDRALIVFDEQHCSASSDSKAEPFAPDQPFNATYYFSVLKSKSMGQVILYSPLIVSTQTTLFTQLESEMQGLVCIADR